MCGRLSTWENQPFIHGWLNQPYKFCSEFKLHFGYLLDGWLMVLLLMNKLKQSVASFGKRVKPNRACIWWTGTPLLDPNGVNLSIRNPQLAKPAMMIDGEACS